AGSRRPGRPPPGRPSRGPRGTRTRRRPRAPGGRTSRRPPRRRRPGPGSAPRARRPAAARAAPARRRALGSPPQATQAPTADPGPAGPAGTLRPPRTGDLTGEHPDATGEPCAGRWRAPASLRPRPRRTRHAGDRAVPHDPFTRTKEPRMTTKITIIFDNPVDPEAFEAAYPDLLDRAREVPGVVHREASKVWPKEDGSPTPAYRMIDLYFPDYDAAS